MIEFFKRISLLDLDENLSMTNLSVIASLIVVCAFPSISMAIVFLVSVVNYCHKRFEAARHYYQEKSFVDQNMVALQNQIDQVKKDHESFIKTADETRKLLSEKNLVKGFTGRGPRQ